jgi:hypothetical protein
MWSGDSIRDAMDCYLDTKTVCPEYYLEVGTRSVDVSTYRVGFDFVSDDGMTVELKMVAGRRT